jgi:hypothetical protein
VRRNSNEYGVVSSDDQVATRVGGIGPDVTGRAERQHAVELEVRAPLGALDEVVGLEGAPAATGLVPPAGAPEQLWSRLLTWWVTRAP